MIQKQSRFLYWTPRVLSIIFLVFLFLMSLDVFSLSENPWEIALGFLIHNIPFFILLIILIIAWKNEMVGGITFLSSGIIYLGLITYTMITSGFEWYYLAWAIQISGIAFFIGALFLIGWFKKRKMKI